MADLRVTAEVKAAFDVFDTTHAETLHPTGEA
jgi:hypothetical protein